MSEMKRRLLKKGDRVRLKVRTIFGWKGTGVVMEDQWLGDDCIKFERDDKPGHMAECLRHEVALLRRT